MRLNAEEAKVCENVARQFPAFVEILNRWRSEELERLPYATNQMDVMRGRVQSLTELQAFLLPR